MDSRMNLGHVSTTDSASNARRALVLGGGALGLGWIAGCATPGSTSASQPIAAPPSTPAPQVKVGDRWVYEEINQYNRITTGQHEVVVTGVGAQVQMQRFSGVPRIANEEVYQPAWQVIRETAYDIAQRFEQPLTIVPASLQIGSSRWLNTAYTVEGVSKRLWWNEQLSVLGWEQLSVPAGRFDVAVIERRIRFEHSDYARQNSTRVDRIWYAPAVNRWVQREWTGQFLWGGRARSPGREDWVRSRLIKYQAA
jgi:hypothetical protein